MKDETVMNSLISRRAMIAFSAGIPLALDTRLASGALAAKSEIAPAVPRCDTRTESETLAEFRWEGHWEAWEREWGGARWIWESPRRPAMPSR